MAASEPHSVDQPSEHWTTTGAIVSTTEPPGDSVKLDVRPDTATCRHLVPRITTCRLIDPESRLEQMYTPTKPSFFQNQRSTDVEQSIEKTVCTRLTDLANRLEQLHVSQIEKAEARHVELVELLCRCTGSLAAAPWEQLSEDGNILPTHWPQENVCLDEVGAINNSDDTGGDFVRKSVSCNTVQSDHTNDIKQTAIRKGEEERKLSQMFAAPAEPKPLLERIVSHPSFDIFFISMIMANAALTALETEYMAHHMGEEIPTEIRVLQHSCSVAFTIELILRLAAFGCFTQLYLREDRFWVAFDFLVVLIGLCELVLDILHNALSIGGVSGFKNLRMFRLVRITRMLRSLRLNRLLRFFSSLRTLVYAIVFTLRSLAWAMVLLALIVFVTAITLTQIATDSDILRQVDARTVQGLSDYWGTLWKSTSTCYQSISGGLSWRDAVSPLQEISMFLVCFFYAYIGFTSFAVLNVVTGVFCSSAMEMAARNPDLIAQSVIANKKAHETNLANLFSKLDGDQSGTVTYQEFEQCLAEPETKAYFYALGIEPHDAWLLFRLLDVDQGGVIEVEEFVFGCEQLKGSATSLTQAQMQHEVKALAKKVEKLKANVDRKLEMLSESTLVFSEDPAKVLSNHGNLLRRASKGLSKQSSTLET